MINILRRCKSKDGILNISLFYRALFKKNSNIENKMILIKGLFILGGFIVIQLIIASILNYISIDYYPIIEKVFPNINVYGDSNFISALIGIVFSDLIMGLFIIKKLNKLVYIQHGVEELKKGNLDYKIEVEEEDIFEKLATDINSLGENLGIQVEERLKSERMKTDLITNVSHDLKTPLTAIINYIELMKAEDIKPDYVKDYVEVFIRKYKGIYRFSEKRK